MGLAETAEMDRRLASLQTLMIESQDFPPSGLRPPLSDSRIVRSSDNPALDILSRAFDPARTAPGISEAPSLTPASGGRNSFLWQAAVQAHGELLSSALGAAFMSANG